MESQKNFRGIWKNYAEIKNNDQAKCLIIFEKLK